MYTIINPKEGLNILYDKYPSASTEVKSTLESIPGIPIAYAGLRGAIMKIISNGDNGKIHLFDILVNKDERNKLQGTNIHSNRRELEKLQSMIIGWVGDSYRVTITYGAELDGNIFTPIEGPIITIEKSRPPGNNDFKRRVLSCVEGIFKKP